MRRRPLILAAALAAWACGGGDSDSDRPDAGPDVDAAPNPNLVTVRVVSGTQPAVGIHVVFQDAAGALIDATVSGQGGIAEYEVPADGMVTVVPPAGSISTFTKVQPGDSLTFDVAPSGDPLGVVEVSLKGGIGAANQFLVQSGCGAQVLASVAETATINVSSRCVNEAGELAIVAWAIELDDQDLPVRVHGFASVKGVLLTQPVTNVVLPGFVPVADSLTLSVASGTRNPRSIAIGEVIEGNLYGRALAQPNTNPIEFPVDTAIAESIEFDVIYAYDDVTTNGVLSRVHADFYRYGTNDLLQTYDSNDGLPPIESMSIDASDPIRPSISYSAPTTGADLWVATLEAGSQRWDMIAPPQDSTVTLPELPEYLADRWIPASPQAVTGGAIVADLSIVEDYDDARTGFGFSIYASGTPPLGGPGSFVKAALGIYVPVGSETRLSASKSGCRLGCWLAATN